MSDFVEKITLDLDGTAVDGKAAAGLEKTSGGVGSLLSSLKKLHESTGAASMFGGMSAGMVALGTTAVAAAAMIGGAFLEMMTETAKAAADVEKYTMQIASAYGGTNDWASSMERASRVIPGLQKSAIMTGASVEELAKSFRSLSLLTQGSNADVLRVTDSLTVMAKVSGISAETLVSVLQRAALTGQLPLRGAPGREIALNLFPGLSPAEIGAQIKAAQDAGTLLDLLSSKMGDQGDKAKSLSDTWENLAGSWTKISASLKAEIGVAWDPLRVLFADLRNAGISDEFREIAKNIGQIGKEIVASEVRDWVMKWVLFKELLRPLIEDLQKVVFVMEKIGLIKPPTPADVSGLLASSHKAIPGQDTMTQLDLEGIKKGRAEFEKLFETLDREHTLAGLTGIDKTLAEISVKAAKQTEDVEKKWAGAYLDAGEKAKALALINDTAAKKTSAAWEDAYAKQAAAAEKWGKESRAGMDKIFHDTEAANVKYNSDLASLRRNSGDDILAVIKEQADFEIAQMEKVAADAVKQAEIRNTLARDGAEIEAALAAKTAEIREKAALKEATILHARTGDWAAYYDDLVKQAVKAGKGMTEAIQESLRQTAEKAYANAVTIGQGVEAAFLKIRAELKTEGQIWADYIGGIWGGITDGLGSVLKTIETGTGSLKDSLKGMLNSFLDSFNQMVVQMVKRWLFGKKEMEAGGSPLDALFGGKTKLAALDAQGNVKFPTGWSSSQVEGAQAQGGPKGGAGVAQLVGGAATGLGVGTLVGGMSGAPGFATGAAIGGVVGGIIGLGTGVGASLLGALGPTILGLTATGYGIIVAAVLAIIGGLIAVLSQPNTEMHVFGRDFAPQIKAVAEGIQSTMIDIYATSLLPDKAVFTKSLNDRIKAYIAHAMGFGVHAGSTEDIQGDIKTLLSGVIPTELLHTLIGQQRIGGQDMAGIGGASKYGGALDPSAPINKMLTDLGFTAKRVQELAGQIDTMAPEDWMKQLGALVGVVAGAQALGKQLSKSYAETIADVDAETAKSPAGKLAERAAAVTDLLKAVSFYTGATQITKGQEAIAAVQQFYADAKAAMVQLAQMAKQIRQDAADSITKVQDALKSPAELFEQSTANLEADYQRMRFAANPEDLAAAWGKARADFEAVAGVLVQRVQQIKTVLEDIHTLQAAMITGPGPNAQTDPSGWLAQNMAAMEKYHIAMTAATPGSPEQIAAATSFAGLIRDRYQMELDLLARVKSTIESINSSIGASILQLQLQGIGSVKDGKWVADTHAQGDFMMSQVTALQAQLKTAQTPEEVQRIVSQIQALVSQLGGQQQDPAHYAESLKILQRILEDTRKAAEERLKGMQTGAEFDLRTLGPKLAEAEALMAAALTKVQTDLDALVWHFKRAGEFAAGQIDLWGAQIADQLNLLGPILEAMVKNFTDVNTALEGGGTGGGPKPLPKKFDDLGAGINDATTAVLAFTAALNAGAGDTGAKGANVPAGGNLTVNVTVEGGTPEEIGDAVRGQVIAIVRNSNTELVRALRNNPQALAR